MSNCPFCGSVAAGDVVEANAHAVVFADGYPVVAGHTLVVPRRHVASVFDLAVEEYAALWALVAEVRARLAAGTGAGGFTIGVNDGEAAGQTVGHAHVHVIPRRAGDVNDPRGGVRWVLPDRAACWAGLPGRQEFLDRQADVAGDLAEQDGRDVAVLHQQSDDLARLQDRRPRHGLRHGDCLDADEFGVEGGVAVLEQQADDLLQVAVQFVEGLALTMCPGEPGHIPDVQPGIGVTFDDRGEGPHGLARLLSSSKHTTGAPEIQLSRPKARRRERRGLLGAPVPRTAGPS